MLRANTSLFKKIACAFLIVALAFPQSVSGIAEEDDDLYFGALEESLASNVKTAVVEKGEFSITGAVAASLNFSSTRMVFNEISEGNVRFEESLIRQGASVKKGDPLIKIHVEIDEIEKEEIELNLAAAEKNLEEYVSDTKLLMNQYKIAAQEGSERDRKLAQLSYERLDASFKKELEKRETQIDSYNSRLDEIEALASTEYIYSPYDGVVGFTSNFRNNEIIGRWSFICMLNEPSTVSVVVEGGSELLRYNMPVKIVQQSNGGKNVELTGRVKTLKSTASSVNLIAQDDIIEIYGDASQLSPGREVSIRFDKIYMPDALMVPSAAIKNDKKGSYLNVYVNGFSSKRYVVVGGSDGSRYWIVSGVEEGDIIILD